jgi:hypothetical protein
VAGKRKMKQFQVSDRVYTNSDLGGVGGMEFIPKDTKGVITNTFQSGKGSPTIEVTFNGYSKPKWFIGNIEDEYMAIRFVE